MARLTHFLHKGFGRLSITYENDYLLNNKIHILLGEDGVDVGVEKHIDKWM